MGKEGSDARGKARAARHPADDRSPSERLADALAQQAATSEILRVMASSPDTPRPVLDAIAREAARLCRAPDARVFLADGGMLHPVATFPPVARPEHSATAVPIARSSITGRAVLTGSTVHHADVVPLLDTEFPDARANVTATGCRAVLAVPLPGKAAAHGAIFLWRKEPEAFSTDLVALVETFAQQAAIALGSVRQLGAVREALERETATSEILSIISRSPRDTQPVFETIAHAALRLCQAESVVVVTYDGALLHAEAIASSTPGSAEAIRIVFPRPASRDNGITRAVLANDLVVIADVTDDPEYATAEPALASGFRSVVALPLRRDGRPIGAISLGRAQPGAFADAHVALLRTFADQAVIAIENVRLFNELGQRNRDLEETLEQQTATSDILRVISGSPTDVQPVFDTIATSALRLCGAAVANVVTYDGELVRVAALASAAPGDAQALNDHFRTYPRPPSHDTANTRAVLTRAVVSIPDVLEDREYAAGATAVAAGYRGVLAVPLLRGEIALGAVTVARPLPGPFADKQVALLKTFADQAVIAIENVRLFKELQRRNHDLVESLEQQTATSDILRVISRTQTDVQPVFDTIAAAVLKLCRAEFANVFTYDGALIHLAAAVNVNADYVERLRTFFPRPPGRYTAVTRAIASGEVCAIPDVLTDEEYAIARDSATGGFRSVLAVPLLREGRAIGGIALGRPQPGPFPEAQVALLQTFADQAVIAIENVRLFNELERRNHDLVESLEQQTATSDILRVISRTQTDVQPVFDEIAAAALKLCRASAANVFIYDGELVRLAALITADPSPEYAETLRKRWPMPAGRGSGATRAIVARSVVEIPDILADADYVITAELVSGGLRSVLSVPLLRNGEPIGAISVGRKTAGTFPPEQVALLQTFADQAVIAIENVRLFNELRARTDALTRSVGELRALGEVGQAISSTLDLPTVLSTIVARATGLTGMDGGSIYEYDEAAEEFHLHMTDRLPDDLVAALRAHPIRKGEGLLGRMALAGEPVQIPDIVDEGAYRSRVREVLVGHGYRALLAVPLWRDEHLLGGLAVNRKTPGPFAPDVIALLETFAAQSAIAIQNARLFRELALKGRLLEQASRHKSEFLANMSHELRTPLNAIIGFSEVLAERMFGELNDKQGEYVGDILTSGRHLLALINDILDLSKIEAGRLELDIAEFDVAAAVGNALTLVRERAQRRDIALHAEVDAGIGAVHGDERKVKQVLLNLLSNALKFTPAGGTIDVRAADLGDAVEIAVRDSGVGIAPEDQKAVFEEFRQVGMMARQVEGTGLGLAISRKFVELHGGTIRVESELGRGATFTIHLPRRVAETTTPCE